MDLLSVTAMGIGSVVGAGIFALLGQVTLLAGNLTYWSFIIAGIAALFSGYSYDRLAGKYPNQGGLTEYVRIAFKSKFATGLFSIIYVITSLVSISMMAKSFGIYGAKLFPDFPHHDLLLNLFAATAIIGLGFLNMLSADKVGRAEILMVAFKFFVLVTLIVAAFAKFKFIPNQVEAMPDNLQFLGSIGITFFAYAGYGIITNAAADVRNPEKTIGRAIYLTIIIVNILYISLAFVILKFIPAKELLENPETVVALAARKLFGDWGYVLMYIAAVFAFISGISATFFSTFRIARALANQKILPAIYHRHFWENGTYGNLVNISFLTLLTVIFDFSSIVNLASGAYLVTYLVIFSAAWRLRKQIKANPFLILAGAGLMIFILVTFILSIF